MRDTFALGGGPYHFFARSSRSAAASSICSARSFFSLAFSSSSCFRRLASETSMPPYLAFQLYSVALRDAVLAREIGRLRARLVLPQHANNLLFRKPGSLHLSFLHKAGLLLRVEEVCSGRSPEQWFFFCKCKSQ